MRTLSFVPITEIRNYYNTVRMLAQSENWTPDILYSAALEIVGSFHSLNKDLKYVI